MIMINTDYKIEALEFLLDRSCIPERYFPLLADKDKTISGLLSSGCKTKSDAQRLSDDEYIKTGTKPENIALFRKFLTLYDVKKGKLKEIEGIDDKTEKAAFYELYHLPGVKSVRAKLYYLAGYKTVRDFANSTVTEVTEKTSEAILKYGLNCTPPLPKEVRTQIACAKAFTLIPQDFSLKQ